MNRIRDQIVSTLPSYGSYNVSHCDSCFPSLVVARTISSLVVPFPLENFIYFLWVGCLIITNTGRFITSVLVTKENERTRTDVEPPTSRERRIYFESDLKRSKLDLFLDDRLEKCQYSYWAINQLFICIQINWWVSLGRQTKSS